MKNMTSRLLTISNRTPRTIMIHIAVGDSTETSAAVDVANTKQRDTQTDSF